MVEGNDANNSLGFATATVCFCFFVFSFLNFTPPPPPLAFDHILCPEGVGNLNWKCQL